MIDLMISRRHLVPFLLVSAVALAACGGSEEAASSTTTTTAVAASAAPAATDPAPIETDPAPVETDPAPVVTEPAPVETDPPPATNTPDDGSDGACLIGDWVITQDELNAYLDTVTAGFGDGPAPVEIDVVGQALLTFTASDYVYTADFDLTLVVAGITGTGVSTGTVSGTWKASDDRIVTELEENALDVIVTAAGQTRDASDLAGGFLTSSPVNEAPFDCAGPILRFQADATGAVRHDVTLTPA